MPLSSSKFGAFVLLLTQLISCVISTPSSQVNVTELDVTSLDWDDVYNVAGYMAVADGQNHLFYWLFESRNDPANDPLILWLNGGPACSSMKGLMWVNGPSIIQRNLSLVRNPYSWNSNASVIWLDQPAGTGLSYGSSNVTTDSQLSQQIYQFLEGFFQTYPQYKKVPFHLAGGSDAGLYVPDLAAEILSHDDRSFNLQSISIGNGLIDTQLQYQYMQPMFCGSGGIPPVLDAETCKQMDLNQPLCVEKMSNCLEEPYGECAEAYDFCEEETIFKYNGNYFNAVQPCSNATSQCYAQDTYYVEYLNQPHVKEVLQATNHPTVEACNQTVADGFINSGAQLRDSSQNLTAVLENRIPVLLFAGDVDLTYNWIGNRAVAQSVYWPGQLGFDQAPVQTWTVNGVDVGEVQHYDILTFLRVFDAGHLVSWDQPAVALKMLNTWLTGNWSLV